MLRNLYRTRIFHEDANRRQDGLWAAEWNMPLADPIQKVMKTTAIIHLSTWKLGVQ